MTIPLVPQANTATGCPLTAAVNAIGGRWNLICLYWLDTGPKRFNELRRLMPDLSHKVLTETLRSLEKEDLIFRTVLSATPIQVQYTISAHGQSVRPLIHAIRIWGHAHLMHVSQQTSQTTLGRLALVPAIAGEPELGCAATTGLRQTAEAATPSDAE